MRPGLDDDHSAFLFLPPFSIEDVSLELKAGAMCPFLKKTSPATLRSLSTATHHSPGGGTITNLQFIARRCPVMNKALAVQSARMRTSNYTSAAPSVGVVRSMLAKKLHTSAEKKANVDTRIYRKGDDGQCFSFHTRCIVIG